MLPWSVNVFFSLLWLRSHSNRISAYLLSFLKFVYVAHGGVEKWLLWRVLRWGQESTVGVLELISWAILASGVWEGSVWRNIWRGKRRIYSHSSASTSSVDIVVMVCYRQTPVAASVRGLFLYLIRKFILLLWFFGGYVMILVGMLMKVMGNSLFSTTASFFIPGLLKWDSA